MPAIFPKYRLEFTNGEIHTINISPEIRNDSNYKRLLREIHNPPPRLIEKRVKEFIQMENIKATLKEAKCINPSQLYISKLYSSIISITFIFKVFIIYFTLLSIRFIIWAVRTLRRKNAETETETVSETRRLPAQHIRGRQGTCLNNNRESVLEG